MLSLWARCSGWTRNARRWRHPPRRRPTAAAAAAQRPTPPSDSSWKVEEKRGEGSVCWADFPTTIFVSFALSSFAGFVQSISRADATDRRDSAKDSAVPPVSPGPAATPNGCGSISYSSGENRGNQREKVWADEATKATSVCHARQRQWQRQRRWISIAA